MGWSPLLFYMFFFTALASYSNSFAFNNRLFSKTPKSVNSLDSAILVNDIYIKGNKTTKDQVVLNEMTFTKGTLISGSDIYDHIERSKNNLLNTSLFNFVSITFSNQDSVHIAFNVVVEERWYWWVFPLFEQADRNVSSFLKNNDWARMNYGVYLRKDNFRGRNELLKFRLLMGYSTQISLSFNSPEYKNRTGWGASVQYKFYDNIPFTTQNNQPIYFQQLGKMIQFSFSTNFQLNYRSGLYTRHQISLTYNHHQIDDSVFVLSPDYLGNQRKTLQYAEVGYSIIHDIRDSKVYPLKGSLQQLSVAKTGLGIGGNDLNYYTLIAKLHWHKPIADRWHTGTEWNGSYLSASDLPYVIHSGLGYQEYLNGYEYYVIDGSSSVYAKSKLMYTLVKTRVKYLEFMPLNKFSKIHYALYVKAIFDQGYVYKSNAQITNNLSNSYLYSYGLGIDFVTFYDKVLSFSYAFNKMGNHGLFVHLDLKI